MDEKFTSRFIINSDPNSSKFIFDLPETWPTRYYEYIWASAFAKFEDVALDAASGICHPLKFFLSQKCKEVHACDIDNRILSPYYIMKEIEEAFGIDIASNIPHEFFHDVTYAKANLTALPYSDKKFDKVYCISVIEHMSGEDIKKALVEFNRVLKDDGLIVLTFDYPTINLDFLKISIEEAGLEFVGEVNFSLPDNSMYSDIWEKLYCFRAVLKNNVVCR